MGLLDLFQAGGPLSLRPARAIVNKDEDLFDDEFQRKLDYLALVSRKVFAGRMRAERRTKKSGSGIEFADHRDYQPGDDFRYLDWNVYQKFGRLLLRLYEEEEDLSVYLIIDASGSMAFGDGEKLKYAKKVCAALAYVGLANLDRVGIVSTSDKVMDRMPETRGKGRIFKVFRFLRELEPAGVTDLGDALKTFVAQHKRRGLAVLITRSLRPEGLREGHQRPSLQQVRSVRRPHRRQERGEAEARGRRAPLRLRDGRRARGHRDGEGPRALRPHLQRVPPRDRPLLHDANGPLHPG